VVGDKVVAAMKRQASEGEFRSNLSSRRFSCLIRLTPEERSTAVRAARIMGLNVCGVDSCALIMAIIMEVHSSPGLKGIEASSGKDIAELIIQFIEKRLESMETAKDNHHPYPYRGKG